MTEYRAWVRRAMARSALSLVLALLAAAAVVCPACCAALVGRDADGPSVSWVILVAGWGAVVASMGAGSAWTRAAEAS